MIAVCFSRALLSVQGAVSDILLKSIDLPQKSFRPACVDPSVSEVNCLPVINCSSAKVGVSTEVSEAVKWNMLSPFRACSVATQSLRKWVEHLTFKHMAKRGHGCKVQESVVVFLERGTNLPTANGNITLSSVSWGTSWANWNYIGPSWASWF